MHGYWVFNGDYYLEFNETKKLLLLLLKMCVIFSLGNKN